MCKSWVVRVLLCVVAVLAAASFAGFTTAAKAGERVEIAVPSDPAAADAFRVLEKHCARCHQDGRLSRLKPAKNFGNILHLDEIARDPNLVLPGNPDASPLYNQIARQSMPYDVYQEFSGGAEPTEADLLALRGWIEELGKKRLARCEGRKLIPNQGVWSAIAADLRKQPGERRAGMRYISLSHLYSACSSDKAMNVYRLAVVKLLNSLSRNEHVLTLRTIDSGQTVIAFHLDDLAWDRADWNRVLVSYPYAMPAGSDDAAYVETVTETPLAWVRGDWFAYSASRPPLYHDLLKLPTTFAHLQQLLGVDVAANIETNAARRAGFQDSLISRNNRLIERHPAPGGVFWTSYDFEGNRSRQDLFEYPLGPGEGDVFQHDGGETVFSLRNGFNGYFLNTKIGRRLDFGPTTIVQDQSQRDLRVTNGISCMGCHVQGYRKASDEIRAHVLASKSFPDDVRDKVAALYAEPAEMNRLLDTDIARFRKAMQAAGIDPDLDFHGVEIINALSHCFARDVDLRLAAAEFGMGEQEFLAALDGGSGEAHRMRRRLQQGTVPRDTFEAQFASLVEAVAGKPGPALKVLASEASGVARVGDGGPQETGVFDLVLYSDKSEYDVDEFAVFTVKSEADCHLTLINVDGNGNGTVIFPNEFQQDNFLPRAREMQFPDDRSPYTFRLQDRGTETVIAVCNADPAASDGIRHDFRTRSFTPLGNYRKFVTRQIVVAGRAKLASRPQGAAPEAPAAAAPQEPAVARTAIKFRVR